MMTTWKENVVRLLAFEYSNTSTQWQQLSHRALKDPHSMRRPVVTNQTRQPLSPTWDFISSPALGPPPQVLAVSFHIDNTLAGP